MKNDAIINEILNQAHVQENLKQKPLNHRQNKKERSLKLTKNHSYNRN